MRTLFIGLSLLATTAAFSEITEFTVCDHNKGQYSLIHLNKTKITNSCLVCTIKDPKCCEYINFIDPDQKEIKKYYCPVISMEAGYPEKQAGIIRYDIDTDKIDIFNPDNKCLNSYYYLEQIGTRFEVKRCP